MAKKCPNCGAEVADEAKFCPHCGFSMEEKVEETRFMDQEPEAAQPTMHGQFASTEEEGFPWGWTVGQFAGFWRRLVAWCVLDALILGAIETVVILVLWGLPTLVFGLIDENLTGIGGLVGALLALAGAIVAYVLYVIVPTAKTGQTLGKRIMGIKVVDKDKNPPGMGKAFLREIVGKAVSGFVFCLGFLWAGFDNQRRAWHDRMAGTFVVPK